MIYVIIDRKYSDGEGLDAFIALVEGDEFPKGVLEVWARAKWAEMDAWHNANPAPAWAPRPSGSQSDEAWTAYAKAQRDSEKHSQAQREKQNEIDERLGKEPLDALLKAGFRLVEHRKVEL